MLIYAEGVDGVAILSILLLIRSPADAARCPSPKKDKHITIANIARWTIVGPHKEKVDKLHNQSNFTHLVRN